MCSRRLAKRVLMWWVFFGNYVPYIKLFCVFNLFHSLCVALSRYVKCTMLFVDIAKLVDIESTLCFHQISLCIVAFISSMSWTLQCRPRSSQNRFYIAAVVSCLHCRHCWYRNGDLHRFYIVSTLSLLYIV